VSPDIGSILERSLQRRNLFTPVIHEKLSVYVRELERWNSKVNLTALHGEELVERLVTEPADIGRQLHMSGTLVDIGSGNGSPGIPLQVTGGLETHLIEARTRRAAFLRHVANLIDGEKLIVHKARAEDIRLRTKSVDWISMQAVHPSTALISALTRWASATTRVVWITNLPVAPSNEAKPILREDGSIRAWVFKLDQS
jgi:16S rRNA (guanine(527)-N(7))-methyltransferase RsmG